MRMYICAVGSHRCEDGKSKSAMWTGTWRRIEWCKPEGILPENSLLLRKASLFVPFSPSTNWIKPLHIMKGNLHYPKFTNFNVNLIQKHPSHWHIKLTTTHLKHNLTKSSSPLFFSQPRYENSILLFAWTKNHGIILVLSFLLHPCPFFLLSTPTDTALAPAIINSYKEYSQAPPHCFLAFSLSLLLRLYHCLSNCIVPTNHLGILSETDSDLVDLGWGLGVCFRSVPGDANIPGSQTTLWKAEVRVIPWKHTQNLLKITQWLPFHSV